MQTCSVWKLWTIFVFILLLSPVTSSIYSLLLFVLPVFPPLRIAVSWRQAEKARMEKQRRSPSPLAVCSLFFLLTWQRDNPSRFTSSEFTFPTFRITYLILKSYMGVWYPSRMSGVSLLRALQDSSFQLDVFRLYNKNKFGKEQSAQEYTVSTCFLCIMHFWMILVVSKTLTSPPQKKKKVNWNAFQVT